MTFTMFKKPGYELLYLSPRQQIPAVLNGLVEVQWTCVNSLEQLKTYLDRPQGELFVIVQLQELSQRSLQAFSTWIKLKVKIHFIFIVQSIESACFKMYPLPEQMLVLFQSEGERIAKAVMRKLVGLKVQSRKQERLPAQSQVMVKKSALTEESPTGKSVQFLREGVMQDFSKGGAQLEFEEIKVKAKDFISLMYQNRHGRWVSVESQVRWVSVLNNGKQVVGVQFLAVNT